MEARHMAWPLSEAMVCGTQEPIEPLILRMQQKQFDYCPVVDNGEPVGIFSRLGAPASVAQGTQALRIGQLISADTPILELARKLDEHDFIFVLTGSRISGFITPSDLGSTLARSFAYLQLASVEIGLSDFLRGRFHRQEFAIEHLTQARRAAHAVLVSSLREADQYIDDIAACSLEDLLRLAGKDAVFREALPAGRGWQRLKSGLSDFRNDVMHPARPLVGPGVRDVGKFVEKIENLQILAHTADRLNAAPTSLGIGSEVR